MSNEYQKSDSLKRKELSSNIIKNQSSYDNIREYLELLNTDQFNRLFSQQASCLAIFRLLSPLAKQIVMSLLFTEDKISLPDLFSWFKSSARHQVGLAIKDAMKYRVLLKIKPNKKPKDPNEGKSRAKYIMMNSVFKAQYQNVLCCTGPKYAFGKPEPKRKKSQPSFEEIEAYAQKKRERILHYMVGTEDEKIPEKKVRNLLIISKLMQKKVSRETTMKITHKGFQFLLKDEITQIWTFLLQYILMRSKTSDPLDPVDALQFYFLLSSMEFGQSYAVSSLTNAQKSMLPDLIEFGVIYQRKPSSSRFFPTNMATSLMLGELANISYEREKILSTPEELKEVIKPKEGMSGSLIIETNYRVYAYTRSKLQISILNLFMSLNQRYENMAVGFLDRDSVRRAFSHGITSAQIISYLETHAHSIMRTESPVIPLTVVDQIKLWELERLRIRPTRSNLWSGFTRQQDFNALHNYAKSINAVVYANVDKKILVVTNEGQSKIKKYARKVLSADG